jgi:hypothetical protein
VSARPCPPGTGTHIVALIGGIFGVLIGITIYAACGAARRGRTGAIGMASVVWSLLFLTLAASVAFAAYGPARNDSSGAKGVAIVLGVLFVPMGLAPLVMAALGRGRSAEAALAPARTARAWRPAARAAVGGGSGGDPAARLERLGELRAKGLITEAEFEEQKQRVLGDL